MSAKQTVAGTGAAAAIIAAFAALNSKAKQYTDNTKYPALQAWWSRLDPVAKDVISGAGMGTGIGALTTLLTPEDKKDRRSGSERLLDNLVIGGATGGLAGLGVNKLRPEM